MKLKIEKLVYEGKGLGREESGKPIFVKKSVPDDELEIEIVKNKSSFSEGFIKKIIKSSPMRIDPKCPHFERCGGCDHQNIAYCNQLKFKEEIFRETLSRAKIETEILPIIPSSNSEFYYRNVIRFFFVRKESGEISFAMHDYVDFNKLVPVDSCLLQSEKCNKILKSLSNLLNENSKDDLSSLWQLRIREGKDTGEFMIEFITQDDHLPRKNELISILKSDFPEVKSCYHTTAINKKIINSKRRLLFGSPIIYEKIGKFTFQISPESFFQTNSLGVKNLYDKIKEFTNIQMGDNVLDLFCGTGTIGIYLSTLAKKVVGIEIVQSAINDARANAKINKVSNCEFICDDVTKWLHNNIEEIKKYKNVKIVLDPPRQGLNEDTIKIISELLTLDSRLIYVSCNPATFARDIKIFEESGFALKKAEPLDMFPQTHHIECIGLISKK